MISIPTPLHFPLPFFFFFFASPPFLRFPLCPFPLPTHSDRSLPSILPTPFFLISLLPPPPPHFLLFSIVFLPPPLPSPHGAPLPPPNIHTRIHTHTYIHTVLTMFPLVPSSSPVCHRNMTTSKRSSLPPTPRRAGPGLVRCLPPHSHRHGESLWLRHRNLVITRQYLRSQL